MSPDAAFGTWNIAESPVAVEYSLAVIEEIRRAATAGFHKLSRGGIEVGGVLYGTHENGTVRILAMQEIACQHARGPSFLLSDQDRKGLSEQLTRDAARFPGMAVVGWFVSHTRSGIALSESDLGTFREFFGEPWQVTMVVQPSRTGATRAGFFVREPDGSVKSDRSYLDFDFPGRPAGADGGRDRGADEGLEGEDAAPVVAVSPVDAPSFGAYNARSGADANASGRAKRTRGWAIAAIVIVLVAGAAVAGLRYLGSRWKNEPIALSVLERDGQLQIQWNHNSHTVTGAARGALQIVDGGAPITLPLSAQDLAKGSLTYARRSGDVQVRLEVQNSSGDKALEASRFLGAAPEAVDANEVDATRLERDALQDEVTRLRRQNAQQATRIEQLERTLTILRARLGIDQPKR